MKPTSDRQRAMSRAYGRAKGRLAQEFPDRFRELYEEECASVGITPGPPVPDARTAAEARWTQCEDRAGATAAARKAFADKFEKLVDPDGKLDPAERARRAQSARSDYYRQLAARSRRTEG